MARQATFNAITEDFRALWTSVAARRGDEARGRANFILAYHSLVFLEWIGRVCAANTTKADDPAARFAEALEALCDRYFTKLPSPLAAGPDEPQFFVGRKDRLISVAFHLIRNGIAHTYSDTPWSLRGRDERFEFCISGVKYRQRIEADDPKMPHLGHASSRHGLFIRYCPGVAFTHFESAARAARVPHLKKAVRFPAGKPPASRRALEAAFATFPAFTLPKELA